MKTLYSLVLLFTITTAFAQQDLVTNQNPNYKVSYDKYVASSEQYTDQQGTTVQETYVAIDPIEEKRNRKKIRKDYRAQRSLWRHQERMERAKNTRYVRNTNTIGLGWNQGFGFSRWGIGYSNFNNFGRRGLGCSYILR